MSESGRMASLKCAAGVIFTREQLEVENYSKSHILNILSRSGTTSWSPHFKFPCCEMYDTNKPALQT